jgi:hypothetical protein
MLTKNPKWKEYQKYQLLRPAPLSPPIEMRKKRKVKLSEQNKDLLNEQSHNSNVFYGELEKEYRLEKGQVIEVEEKKIGRPKKED